MKIIKLIEERILRSILENIELNNIKKNTKKL